MSLTVYTADTDHCHNTQQCVLCVASRVVATSRVLPRVLLGMIVRDALFEAADFFNEGLITRGILHVVAPRGAVSV